MRRGFIVDVLTIVDVREIFKIGGKVLQPYEDVLQLENLQVSSFKKVIDKLFELRQKVKEEKFDVLKKLVKFVLNSLYGEQIRKDIEESYSCKSEHWMQTEYDEGVLDYQKNNYGNYIVEMKVVDGLPDEVKKSYHLASSFDCICIMKL